MLKQVLKLRKNQTGSSLILVILCMVFIGLLASAVLTATVSNMNMKTVDAFAKDNFYTAEMAMDELKVGLEEIAQNKLREAFTLMLSKYAVTPDTERVKQMRIKWANLFYNELAVNPMAVTGSAIQDDKLRNCLITSNQTNIDFASIKVIKDLTKAIPEVIIKDVTLAYTDASGYKTTITTDLKFTATSANLSSPVASRHGVYYTDFTLIADKLIENKTDNSFIYGSIYGGEGIVADSLSELNLTSKKIISRGRLEALDKGKIIVKKIENGTDLVNQVWVNNIVTTKTFPWESSDSATEYLNIHANSYVGDDLTLNAKGGNVKMFGKYYGFNSDNPGIEPTFSTASSSIVVNASKATLDLSGLDKLVVSGKNNVSLPQVYGDPSSSYTVSGKAAEGEAMSFKGSQIAYLVPGDCIIGIGHNPMTEAEYNNFLNPASGCSINLTEFKGFDLTYYVDSATPYRAVGVNYLNSLDPAMRMVYFYLNFYDPDYASDYFQKYLTKGGKAKLEKLAEDMELADVKFPTDTSKILNTGNLMSYDSSTKKIDYRSRKNESNNTIGYQDGTVQNYDTDMTIRYLSLVSYLQERNTISMTPSLAKTLVRYDDEIINGIPYRGIISLASPPAILYTDGNPSASDADNPYILVTTQLNNVVLSGGSTYGIIIATGDVELLNCDFTGMIITTGNIKLGSGCTIHSDEAGMKTLLEGDPELYKHIRDYEVLTSTLDTSMIAMTYENWHKK